jgi:ketosteroid isomerase-like protein
MHPDNVTVVRNLYDAYRRKDTAAIFQALDLEVEVYQSELLPWGGRYKGHDQVQSSFAKLTEHLDSHAHVDQIIDAVDQVVAVGRSRGRAKANGKEFDLAVAHVWTLRQGKVRRLEAYLDTPAMLNALRG